MHVTLISVLTNEYDVFISSAVVYCIQFGMLVSSLALILKGEMIEISTENSLTLSL